MSLAGGAAHVRAESGLWHYNWFLVFTQISLLVGYLSWLVSESFLIVLNVMSPPDNLATVVSKTAKSARILFLVCWSSFQLSPNFATIKKVAMCFSGLQTLPHFPCLNSVTLGSDLRIWVQSLEFRFHGGCRGFREITYFSASILYLLSECFLAVVASNLLSVTLWRPSLLQTARFSIQAGSRRAIFTAGFQRTGSELLLRTFDVLRW